MISVTGMCCCLLEIISRTRAISRCSDFLLGAIRQYRLYFPRKNGHLILGFL